MPDEEKERECIYVEAEGSTGPDSSPEEYAACTTILNKAIELVEANEMRHLRRPMPPGAVEAVRAAILARQPYTDLFVNCPSRNILPSSLPTVSIGCEFRALLGTLVIYEGRAIAVLANGNWTAVRVLAISRAPDLWVSCGTQGLTAPGQSPVRLRAHGAPCGDARFMANELRFRASKSKNLRLPLHLTTGWYGTNTIGFVTNSFKCWSLIRVRLGGRSSFSTGRLNPYGEETASCSTRFDDRFIFTFDQGS